MSDAAYDPTTTIGAVRLTIGDTDAADYIFSDAEITVFLSQASLNTFGAGALAYGVIIRSKALLAKKVKREGYENEQYAIADLLAIKKDLEDQSIESGGLQIGEFILDDSHLESYRPEFVDEVC